MSEDQSTIMYADKPLTDPEDDLFGYAPFAETLAKGIQDMLPPEGLVMAIHGEWGSGKSTMVEFILHYLKEDDPKEKRSIVIRFNPWWFSGHDDLMDRFILQVFGVLVSKLGRTIKGLGKLLKRFSRALGIVTIFDPRIRIVGTLFDKLLNLFSGSTNQDIFTLKDQLAKKLSESNRKILIVIDDIDRLTPDEIRQLFTVIKAVADFPNVAYLLAFDRQVVEAALQEHSHRADSDEYGANYLEKIVQVSFELPLPSKYQLGLILEQQLRRIVGEVPDDLKITPLDEHFNPEWFPSLSKFFSTPRDIYRFTNTLRVSYPAVANDVSKTDFIIIEILRIFRPNFYDLIRRNKLIFTTSISMTGPYQDSSLLEKNANEIRKDLDENADSLAMYYIKQIFPGVFGRGRPNDYVLRATRSVSHANFFDLYFRMTLSESEVPKKTVDEFIEHAADRQKLTSSLLEFVTNPPELTQSLFRNIRARHGMMPQESIKNLVTVLLNIGDELGRKSGLKDNIITPLCVDLLRNVILALDKAEQYTLIHSAIQDSNAILTMLAFLGDIKYSHGQLGNSGPEFLEEMRILDEDHIPEIEELVLNRLNNLASNDLLCERPPMELKYILQLWVNFEPEEERRWVSANLVTPEKLLPLLSSFRQTVHFPPISSEEVFLQESVKECFELDQLEELLTGWANDDNLTEQQKSLATELLTAVKKLKDPNNGSDENAS